jgi:hypothetical protein
MVGRTGIQRASLRRSVSTSGPDPNPRSLLLRDGPADAQQRCKNLAAFAAPPRRAIVHTARATNWTCISVFGSQRPRFTSASSGRPEKANVPVLMRPRDQPPSRGKGPLRPRSMSALSRAYNSMILVEFSRQNRTCEAISA